VIYKPYNPEDARQLVKNRVLSPEKAEKEIGFKYIYSVEEGLKKLIEWRRRWKKGEKRDEKTSNY